MNRRRLPIGIQTFRELRERDCYYVDKTAYMAWLADEGKHYFLSRPRRFGKSLFLDTLKELFEGNEPLFEGLAVHDGWDWSVRHPVLRLSFGSGHFRASGGLHANVMAQLDAGEAGAGVSSDYSTAPERFQSLLAAVHRRAGRRVVVLIDEYDKPILDVLDVPDLARANRDYLRSVYAVVKDSDAHVRFTFLTGVSKFSKVSLFSGINNLIDITLDPRFSAVCGYTDADLDTVFAAELAGLDRDEIRRWYDGYNWLGEENVYNPYDVLLLPRNRTFDAWWFETGAPSFLVETLLARGVGSMALGSADLLSSFDVDHIATEALLFQTGYLTIAGVENLGGKALYEGYYASVFYSHFAALGLDVVVEEGSSRGRLDMAVRFNAQVYLFEFKVVELAPEGAALAQLKAKRYADKYRGLGRPIHLIAVEFSREARNVAAFEVETA